MNNIIYDENYRDFDMIKLYPGFSQSPYFMGFLRIPGYSG